MTKTSCYHVTVSNGAIYGVAATNKTDARMMVAKRISEDGDDTAPTGSVEKVGTWDAEYGTVLQYTAGTDD